MKKLTALLLSLVLVLGLAACGSANKPATSTTQPEASAPTEQPTTAPTESASTAPSKTEPEPQPETGKTLVVYYSASGNTERVAKDIAETAGADLVLFGQVWSREAQLSPRDRSLITIAALVGSGILSGPLVNHIRMGKAHGITEAEISEALTQLAFYAGWPKAWAALRIAKEVYEEDAQ